MWDKNKRSKIVQYRNVRAWSKCEIKCIWVTIRILGQPTETKAKNCLFFDVKSRSKNAIMRSRMSAAAVLMYEFRSGSVHGITGRILST